MASRMKGVLRRARFALGIWIVGALILVGGLVLAYQFVGPAPPKQVVLATGAHGGAYQLYGDRLVAHLAEHGIDVDVRTSAGALENLQLLQSDSGVDIAFIQSGLVESAAATGVLSLGSLYFEPVWLFANTDTELSSVPDLVGKRIAIGAAGSGTQAVVRRHLELSGISDETSDLLELDGDATVAAMANGSIDAAFLIGGIGQQLPPTVLA